MVCGLGEEACALCQPVRCRDPLGGTHATGLWLIVARRDRRRPLGLSRTKGDRGRGWMHCGFFAQCEGVRMIRVRRWEHFLSGLANCREGG
ncbi:hypothetical protein TNIN_136351 [Trichonephila inaurata madagascariensis]|uniref:Uncharacterized protein n=1 Tax=Trichonephila inaurata madagascariensis TaxID=2747483 RepID=A0A8X6Y223_9ARAC|nr:hypothetical protein TNIN_136351 [Trichonephila inaurata madagascariensis]